MRQGQAGAGPARLARVAARAHRATPHNRDPPQTRTVTSDPSDPFDLQRFVDAQNPVYEQVSVELRDGQKRGHWIWYVFPQLRGLGSRAMATKFGISSREEAEAYLAHPVLGPRLRECTRVVNLVEGRAIGRIFAYPDDLKFRSSMTLFASVAPDYQVFKDALQKYFGGAPDPLTLERLA
jgi:uncharacterized protein (DUF1810 family)